MYLYIYVSIHTLYMIYTILNVQCTQYTIHNAYVTATVYMFSCNYVIYVSANI